MNRLTTKAAFTWILITVATAHMPAQWKVSLTEVLPLPKGERWANARFSPDGSTIFVTNESSNGIWEHTVKTRTTRQITADKGSGYGFSLSNDGTTIAYRKNIPGSHPRNRKQEIMRVDLRTGSKLVLGSARSVSTPVFDGTTPVFLDGTELRNAPAKRQPVTLLGIDLQKIILDVKGVRTTFDPLGNGSYIWPSLSPDGTRIVAYDMDRGAFVSDLKGMVVGMLKRAAGPVWTRDGKWIVYFDEKNDGHQITGSELWAIRPDGTGRIQLTNTSDRVELAPSCSPVDNRIICHTLDGSILVLSYEVVQ